MWGSVVTKDYKAEFLKNIREKKAKKIQDRKTQLEIIRQSKETYKRVCPAPFIKQVLEAVDTIKQEMKDMNVGLSFSHLSGVKDKSYMHFSIRPKDAEIFEDVHITLEAYGNSITLTSNLDVLEEKNDLGDFEPKNCVLFPYARGKAELDDEDIKEIHNQFIRALYDLAQARND